MSIDLAQSLKSCAFVVSELFVFDHAGGVAKRLREMREGNEALLLREIQPLHKDGNGCLDPIAPLKTISIGRERPWNQHVSQAFALHPLSDHGMPAVIDRQRANVEDLLWSAQLSKDVI